MANNPKRLTPAQRARLDVLAEVRRKQRNATAKVNRLKVAKGIDISATAHDPRADAAKLAKATTKQLLAHARKLDDFTNRHTSFVPGAGGVPLSKAKFDRYKAAENAVNGKVDERTKVFGGIKTPGSEMTLGERDKDVMAKRAHGDVRNKPYNKFNRQPYHIASDEALDKLTKSLEKQLTRAYLPKKIKADRENVDKLLVKIGNAGLIDNVHSMTNRQFDLWWHESGSADALVHYYLHAQDMSSAPSDAWYSQVAETRYNEVKESISWAKKELPKKSRKQSNSE